MRSLAFGDRAAGQLLCSICAVLAVAFAPSAPSTLDDVREQVLPLAGTVVLLGSDTPTAELKAEIEKLGQRRSVTWVTDGTPTQLDASTVIAGPADKLKTLIPGLVIGQPSSGQVGLNLPPAAAVVILQREIRLLGSTSVAWHLPAGSSRKAKQINQTPDSKQDWVALRRAAIARAKGVHTGAVGMPRVEHGSLIIAGGGGLPETVWKRFIELAGGPDAPIVILPTAQPDPDSTDFRGVEEFKAAGARNVTVLRQRTPDAVRSPEFLEALRRAKGVWFVGGRQWKYVDAYENTPAVELFRDVLKRGGVIGGTSAGAAIQAEYMVRGSPMGNRAISAEGYEQGFSFLPGTAIDMHLSQRDRLEQLEGLIKTYPQFLGLGVDEKTAIEVSGSTIKTMGEGKVWIVRPTATRSLEPGSTFDLLSKE